MNKSINQTLSRTVMTSGLTFLTVSLFLFGGPVLHGFSFALVFGIIVGTYSSVFIASPIVLFWQNWLESREKRQPRAAPARPQRLAAGRRPRVVSDFSRFAVRADSSLTRRGGKGGLHV